MLLALTRDVSPTFDRCELTYLPRSPIDVAEARRQHSEYKQCLRELGCHVISLSGNSELPDAVFVEDTAIVLDEMALIARPGAVSRQAETPEVRDLLKAYRKLHVIEAPATLDGGDVFRIGKTLFVGLSSRTNGEGVDQLTAAVGSAGYKVKTVNIRNGLHLKSAVTRLADKLILVNPEWVDPAQFGNLEVIEVDPSEPHAANALRVRDRVVYPTQHRKTTARLKSRGLKIRQVDMSEFLKAEGGVTCGSIVFAHPPEKLVEN
ncbi:MAG TPA: arginine deiminase family protein [Rhodothermia bacterium]